jgi:hypothetical protein
MRKNHFIRLHSRLIENVILSRHQQHQDSTSSPKKKVIKAKYEKEIERNLPI